MVYPRTVTHPSTNRARRRATTLIKTNALPLSQAVTSGTTTQIAVNCWILLLSSVPGRQRDEERCAWCSVRCIPFPTRSAQLGCVKTWRVGRGLPVVALRPVVLSDTDTLHSHSVTLHYLLVLLPAFTVSAAHFEHTAPVLLMFWHYIDN